MTENTPYIEPRKLIKGDSVSWKKSFDTYKANDGWILTYYFRGTDTLNKTATASGSDYLVSLTSSDTELTAGDYVWASKVSKGNELITVGSGQIVIETDLADATAGYEARPYVKRVLDKIESLLEGKVDNDAATYSINGRSLTKYSFEELENLRYKYQRQWNNYLIKERRRNGKQSKRKINVRFTAS